MNLNTLKQRILANKDAKKEYEKIKPEYDKSLLRRILMNNVYGLLTICTDGDFAVIYCGETHYSMMPMRFGIRHNEIPDIVLDGKKTEDVAEWLKEIYNNPEEPFSAAGNHEVIWVPQPKKVQYLLSLTPKNAEKLNNYLTQNRVDLDTVINGFIHRSL
jgi:hypothetical protein